jgi:oxygen-independent coproporphyrinogen III oxidase
MADDRLRADLIERLMCHFEVDLAQICARHRTKPEAHMQSAPRLQALVANGIVRFDGDRIRVATRSRILVRTVASAFDAYRVSSGRLHSQAV